jgi:hypothetical protein
LFIYIQERGEEEIHGDDDDGGNLAASYKNLIASLENPYLGRQPGFFIANPHLPLLSRIDLTTCHKSLGEQDLLLFLLIVFSR